MMLVNIFVNSVVHQPYDAAKKFFINNVFHQPYDAAKYSLLTVLFISHTMLLNILCIKFWSSAL